MQSVRSLKANVVLFRPQIHWNTGNIGRTCLGFGAQLHLIGPLGFKLDDKHVKRAGLDYWHDVAPVVFDSWDQFVSARSKLGKAYYFTKFGQQSLLDTKFEFSSSPSSEIEKEESNVCLVFGSETTGLREVMHSLPREELICLPMQEKIRSLNLSNSVSIALWEAYRQYYHSK